MASTKNPKSVGLTRDERRPIALEITLVILAIVWGGILRFERLAAREMSADEAASWASAAAPSVRLVISLGTRLNPGKLPLHDLALHGWIALFGDGLFAMRALSALCGVIAIPLVYLVARELCRNGQGARSEAALEHAALVPGLAALLFALNLVAIKYSREARMYPLLLTAELIQVVLFLRALRVPGLVLWWSLAFLTAFSLATNFSAGFLVAAEAVYLLLRSWFGEKTPVAREPRLRYVALSLAAGLLVLLPLAWAAFGTVIYAARTGTWEWIKRPAFWEPLSFFNKATGTFAFPMLAFVAALGALVAERWRRTEVQFLLIWMWAPVLVMFAFSLTLRPVFVERYALSSFVPFFILAALGIAAIKSGSTRFLTAVLCVALSLGHVYTYGRKPHEAQWREATVLALSSAQPAAKIAVAPAYAVNVARYYGSARDNFHAIADTRLTPVPSEKDAERADFGATAVLILGEQGISASERARLSTLFPHVLSRLRGVEVRLRQ
jgi:hypothetical protein